MNKCQEDFQSTSLNSNSRLNKLLRNQKKTKHKKKFFDMRNIIKKVKTHGMKFYTRCLTNCVDFVGDIKKDASKTTYKLFKFDICKSRNRFILDLSMHEIVTSFSNINLAFLNSHVKRGKEIIFNFLLNITWDEFLSLIKKQNRDVYGLVGEVDNTFKLTSYDIKKYYEYIYQGIDYKKRSNTDDKYIELYEELEKFKRVKNYISDEDLLEVIMNYENL
jgi:hypothetical protein